MDTPCIEWTKAKDKDGYGWSFFRGKTFRAHRHEWILENGEIPSGMFVLHKCDNPGCVNVKHLFLGTHTDNMRDKIAKGRRKLDGRLWEMSGAKRKLEPEDIPKIRAMKGVMTQRAIAKMFGIGEMQISRIMNRQRWGYIP